MSPQRSSLSKLATSTSCRSVATLRVVWREACRSVRFGCSGSPRRTYRAHRRSWSSSLRLSSRSTRRVLPTTAIETRHVRTTSPWSNGRRLLSRTTAVHAQSPRLPSARGSRHHRHHLTGHLGTRPQGRMPSCQRETDPARRIMPAAHGSTRSARDRCESSRCRRACRANRARRRSLAVKGQVRHVGGVGHRSGKMLGATSSGRSWAGDLVEY